MKAQTPCFDGERGSRKIKRRKEYEERSDDGMWSGKLQRWKIASTTTVDCSGKNALSPQWKMPDRNRQWSPRKQCSREITTKTKRTPHHPYLRMYCHVSAARIAGEPPAFRGKPRFCKKDTAKRRRDKEQLFAWWNLQIWEKTETMGNAGTGKQLSAF